jgi:hypothetical protein
VFILPLPSAHNLDSCIFERRRQQLSPAGLASRISAGWRGMPYDEISVLKRRLNRIRKTLQR